jgi:crotonobetainyl-CoA:carnitine CoA-transferase CaiB-like acyl-CoA transferase
MNTDDLPLNGLVVLEFSQFLAGPLCGLRLADLGARVIKIERPISGELGRHLYLSQTEVGGVNSLFQAINRNKESYACNLKDSVDRGQVMALIAQADVVIQNFRPGVFDRLGFSYEALQKINPGIIYASVSGYGKVGPWCDLPGQDLLAQAKSGIMWLNGRDGQAPQPVGLAVADMLAGHNLTQAVLAALVRRGMDRRGAAVDTSLLESMIDFQFEVFTTYVNDGQCPPKRAGNNGAHAYLPAPYGVYPTTDGYIALAMAPVDTLMGHLGLSEAKLFTDPALAFSDRENILSIFAKKLVTNTTQHWLDILQPHDVWCAEVMDWTQMMKSDGFKALGMLQDLTLSEGSTISTTRLPMSFNGKTLTSARPAPLVGEHTEAVRQSFDLLNRKMS